MLVIQDPELHAEGFAGVENQAHILPPILAAKLLVCTGFNADRADATIVYAVQLAHDQRVVLVM